uniref:Protein R52.2, putative n=1 Tax=Brugia malayi TaxID=6279 RepID=A8NNJ5_BRUMA
MLVQSKVGPMIAGSGDIKKLCKNELYPKEVVYSTNANINSELGNFWKLETIGIQESPQDDYDDQALKHFKRTIIKQGGRYQVCWPWKDSRQKLSNNYGLCLGRLKNLINRLQHNSNLHSYHQILMDQLHLGIIEGG